MTVSVFGSTGFVGSAFCQRSKHEIVVVPREGRQSLSDDVLFLISTTHNYHVHTDLHRDIDVNLSLLMDVLSNLERGSGVFNFVSSWFVYGDTTLPAQEDGACTPKGFYSITKLAAERLVASYCETFGIHYRILRLCNVYGKEDRKASAQKNALQYLIERLRNHEGIDLYYGGNFYREYMHVNDVVRAIDVCLERAGVDVVINVGSGTRTRFLDVIRMASQELQSRSVVTPTNPPPFHKVVQVKDFWMDTSRLTGLGFEPSISIEEGIQLLCQT